MQNSSTFNDRDKLINRFAFKENVISFEFFLVQHVNSDKKF